MRALLPLIGRDRGVSTRTCHRFDMCWRSFDRLDRGGIRRNLPPDRGFAVQRRARWTDPLSIRLASMLEENC